MLHKFISSEVLQLAQGQRVPVLRTQCGYRVVSGRSHPCGSLLSPVGSARAGCVCTGAHGGCDFSSLCPFVLCSQGAQIKVFAEDGFAFIKLNILVLYLKHSMIYINLSACLSCACINLS